jgi:hypothetical protein
MTLKDADNLNELIDDDIAALDKSMSQEGYDVCLCTLQMVKQYIKALSTVEAVPIVRCKNCKWYRKDGLLCGYWAGLYEHAETYPHYSPVDFCSRGERKESEE